VSRAVFFVPAQKRKIPEGFLRTWGARLGERVEFVAYEALPVLREVPRAATYVFTALERLSPEGRRATAELAERLAAGARVLNAPGSALARYELLRLLHERRVNPFRAYRVLETTRPERFPVFLRLENEHNGPLSPLLETQRDVERALARAVARRLDLRSVLMVEYVHTADEDGVFRKYMAYVIGDVFLPGNMAFNAHWVVKYGGPPQGEQREEMRTAQTSRAQEPRLREIARLAGIGYGRFDYSFLDGRLCVWELNTNPTLLLPADRYEPEVRAERAELAGEMVAAIERLAAGEDGPPVPAGIAAGASLVLPRPPRAYRGLSLVESLAARAHRPVVWAARRRVRAAG
jgi:hypothetical protein